MTLFTIFFYDFFRLHLYFPDFFQVSKIAGQFQEFKTKNEPCPKHQTFSRQMLTAQPLANDHLL